MRLSFSFYFPQIFVEVELARLTLRLAKMKEEEGKISEACDTLQEIQVCSTLTFLDLDLSQFPGRDRGLNGRARKGRLLARTDSPLPRQPRLHSRRADGTESESKDARSRRSPGKGTVLFGDCLMMSDDVTML